MSLYSSIITSTFLSKFKVEKDKKSRNKKSWIFQYAHRVYRNKIYICQIAKYKNSNKKRKTLNVPINDIEKPLSLKEIIHLYYNYSEYYGFNRSTLYFTEQFAYFTMLCHYKREAHRLINLKEHPNLIHGVDINNRGTLSAHKIMKHLRDLVIYQDIYNNGGVMHYSKIVSKKRDLKKLINRWFCEMEEFDNIDFHKRIEMIKNTIYYTD